AARTRPVTSPAGPRGPAGLVGICGVVRAARARCERCQLVWAILSRGSVPCERIPAMKILVVDDDQAVRESLRRSLTFNGYDVELAGDGVEAIERVDSNRPDAVILDVMMPRRDG